MSNVCTQTTIAGDTLITFSARNNTTPVQVRALNTLVLANFANTSVLPTGLSLQYPCNNGSGLRGPPCMYTVQTGDTTQTLVNRLGVSQSQLLLTNPINTINNPQVGDTVLAPSCFVPTARTYTTGNGDTLQSVANLFNVNVNTLAQVNQIVNQNLFQPFNAGRVLVIPGGSGPIPTPINSCQQLLQDVQSYLNTIGQTGATTTLTYVESGTVRVPVLSVANALNPSVPLFGGIQPINTSVFPPETPFVATTRFYSLNAVQAFLLTAFNGQRAYDCAQQLTADAAVVRPGCQSITVLYSQQIGTSNLPAYGIVGNQILLNVTVPLGSSIPAWFTQFGGTIVQAQPSPAFPQGAVVLSIDFDEFASYLTTIGLSYCEAEGGIIPGDGNCDAFITELRRQLGEGLTNTSATNIAIFTGAVRLRSTIVGTPGIQVPVVILSGYPESVNPFGARGTANTYLQPLSSTFWELVAISSGTGFGSIVPNVTTVNNFGNFGTFKVFDMISVIVWLGAGNNFSSECASTLSAELNPNCLGLLNAFNNIDGSGDRLPSFHARRNTVNLRRALNSGSILPSWFYEYGVTLMNRELDGNVLNTVAVVEIGDLIQRQQRSQLPTCNNLFATNTFGVNNVAFATNGTNALVAGTATSFNSTFNNAINNAVNNELEVQFTQTGAGGNFEILGEQVPFGATVEVNNNGFNQLGIQTANQAANLGVNSLSGVQSINQWSTNIIPGNQLITNNNLVNAGTGATSGITGTINGNTVQCQTDQFGQYLCYIQGVSQ